MATSTAQGSVIPHLVLAGCSAAIDFYTRAFGAEELFRLVEPSGKVGHAEIRIGDSILFLADEYPDFGAVGPHAIGGCPIRLKLYVPDADAAVTRALEAGATLLRAARDEFYGERTGLVADPFGYSWSLSTPVEAVSPAEMQRRFTALLAA